MATIQRINIIGSREGSRNRRRLKANQTGKKFRVGIKSNISTNRNNLISGVDRCIHLNAMKKTTITLVTQFCRKLAAERPLKDIRDEYNYPKKKGIKDECSRLLEASTMKSRRGFAIQRLMNAMRQAHADGWFIVFDTLTLADDRLEAF